MLIWVTGLSGTGKSSVAGQLRARGYTSVDADEDGISGWRDRTSGDLVESPPASQRRADWIDRYGWTIDVSRVEELHARTDDPVFLVGAVENEEDVLPLCDVVVCLVADSHTLRARLTSRRTNDFGKAPGDIDHVLSWREPFEANHRAIGAVLVDTTQPLAAVVDAVIATVDIASSTPG